MGESGLCRGHRSEIFHTFLGLYLTGMRCAEEHEMCAATSTIFTHPGLLIDSDSRNALLAFPQTSGVVK